MENFLKILSNQYVIIGLILLAVLLISVFIVRKILTNKLRKKIKDAEVRYNSLKSVALPFKLNKAVAIARVNQEVMQNVTDCKDDFEEVQQNLKEISQLLADTEDNLLVGKHKRVKEGLIDLDSILLIGEKQVSEMDAFLNTILEKETAQREEVTMLKEQFRNLKKKSNDNSSALSYCWDKIEEIISSNEKMFSLFEEWIYASDFEKANNELINIRSSIKNLELINIELPDLLKISRGELPQLIDEVAKGNAALYSKGVPIKHLAIEDSLLAITSALENDLVQLRDGNCTGVKENLEGYREKLFELNTKMETESSAYNISNEMIDKVQEKDVSLKKSVESLIDLSQVMVERFGYENVKSRLEEILNQLEATTINKDELLSEIEQKKYSAVVNVEKLNKLDGIYNEFKKEIQDIQFKMDQARDDEARAKKQILKLQLIMNEMNVKIRKNRLPSISITYKEDTVRAYEYIDSLCILIDETPLNVSLLNATLKDAIDFIYKLYNNVNNVVGLAIMVENTIVFGNKYRSTYADIDSELTRAELCFRNGEYTQALQIAIATIEKLHPGKYEMLIKENARSAA
ncbi:MAG: septation ring formation regulator EzrA [Anaerorhabdus sp.]